MMMRLYRLFVLCCLLPFILFAKEIETFYGIFDVDEPVLIELIESPSFERLKFIHQYGVAYYTTHNEEYTRYAHSLGVFVLLREKGATLDEQIAGLLHDVSHTVFSHVGDWIFAREHQEEDYQGSIHLSYLEQSGLTAILAKHGFKAAELLPKEEYFPALEQKRPNLCADRIDYNIQGAFYQNFITKEEAMKIFNDLTFREGKWVSSQKELLEKLARYSLFMTQDCWRSPTNHLSSCWLADAILRAVDIQCLTMDEIHFGTDQGVWDKLMECNDPIVREKMDKVLRTPQLYELVDYHEADIIVKSRFMGIDPWIQWEGKCVRLTSLETDLAKEFTALKEKMEKGWAIKLKDN